MCKAQNTHECIYMCKTAKVKQLRGNQSFLNLKLSDFIVIYCLRCAWDRVRCDLFQFGTVYWTSESGSNHQFHLNSFLYSQGFKIDSHRIETYGYIESVFDTRHKIHNTFWSSPKYMLFYYFAFFMQRTSAATNDTVIVSLFQNSNHTSPLFKLQ